MNDPRRPTDPGSKPDAEIPLDPDAILARDAVRELPPVAPEPAYRTGLKAAFASGQIVTRGARAERATPEHGERARSLLPLPFRGRHRLWTGLAAGTALVIAVLVGVLNQGPAWRVSGVRGGGTIFLDGESHSALDASLIGRRVPAGARVEVANAELDLRADGVMAMQVVSGTDLTLPPSPPRWFARRSALRVEGGEIRITTGPAFNGARLEITTPDAAIAVTGTTFAVILEQAGTCVCVLEGTVAVGAHHASPARVSTGHLRFIFRDGRPPADAAMRDAERIRLGDFRAAAMAPLEAEDP